MWSHKVVQQHIQGVVGLLITTLIKVYCWVCLWFFLQIGEYMAKLQARTWLSRALCAPGQHTAKSKKVQDTIHLFARNYAKHSPI